MIHRWIQMSTEGTETTETEVAGGGELIHEVARRDTKGWG